MCRACRQDLVLRAVHPSAKQAPHFRHQNSQDCPATAARRRQVERDDQVVIELRDQLVKAWPGVPIMLELPFEQGDSTQASGLPPAIVVRGQGRPQRSRRHHAPRLPLPLCRRRFSRCVGYVVYSVGFFGAGSSYPS